MEKRGETRLLNARTLVRKRRRIIAEEVMIISCPACGTRYVVPETAIGSDGRTVRCAKCKHSWFQGSAPLDLTDQIDTMADETPDQGAEQPAETGPAAPTSAAVPTSSPPRIPTPIDNTDENGSAETETAEERADAPPTDVERAAETNEDSASEGPSINHWRTEDHPDAAQSTASGSEGIAARALKQGMGGDAAKADTDQGAVETSFESDPLANARDSDSDSDSEPFSDDADYDFNDGYDDDGYDDSEGSRFDYSPPFSRRRNSLKMWTIAAGVFAVLASSTVVAVNYFGLPDWFPVNRPTFGIGKSDLELDFPDSQNRTEVLDSGEEIFRVRGSIRNTGQSSVTVPTLLVVFRDEREKNVYSWVVVPSKRELAPGESLNVTEAVTDIPAAAKAAEIGWSPN
ncbi:zinc-ribbon domain-containing protein [Erythrobacter sp. Alg231-14]|uniref:zinc-ribbon domain-containing protein n=1 Tax=Erythrobacter sp. Alg231-14 TaxID=1922225 RepID=UPI00307C96A8